MATYCCEEVMSLELAIHREISFQKRRRAIDELPFQSNFPDSPPPLSFPLPHPTLPDSFLLIERDIPRKRLQDAAVAARRVPTAPENIPADVAMQREISLRRRAESGRTFPPPKPNVTGADRMTSPVDGGRNPSCLLERTAAATSAQSCGSFGESSSASSQGIPPTDVVGLRNIVDVGTACSSQQWSYNQQRHSKQRFCDLCRVSCSGSFCFYQHCQGKPHKAMLEKLKKEKTKRGPFTCNVCKISCSDMSSLIQHRAGKKHAARTQAIKAQKKPG